MVSEHITAARIGWITIEGGYETTQSPVIIRNTLEYLQKGRVLLNLLRKGYQSGGTILYSIKNDFILIDRPKDWPKDTTKIRVVFRNESRVWMHFLTTVRTLGKDSLKCDLPNALFMLQRRMHYRVSTPQGSRLVCSYNNEECHFAIKDISAGGLLIFAKFNYGIPEAGNHLSKLHIAIPCEEESSGAEDGIWQIKFKEGDIVREFIQERPLMLFSYGVRFYPDSKEEEKILRYVRQRELEVLRKGLTD
jgi:c-di-GMP-binding flagellar brake protein YcgR